MVTSVPSRAEGFRGNDRVLFGIILGVITFWLFAQTTLNIAPDMGRDLGLSASTMNTAVALTALFSGIFIVVIGGLADRFGRVRIVRIGFYLSILGSLLVGVAPAGRWATSFLLPGRALQGLSGACIMPASLALVKTYWDGTARQRAVSLWSIGSWGGCVRTIRRAGNAESRLALHLLWFCCSCLARPRVNSGHSREPGDEQRDVPLRSCGRDHFHDCDGCVAGCGDAGE